MNILHLLVVCSLVVVQPVTKETILETILSEPKQVKSATVQLNKGHEDSTSKKGGTSPDEILLKQGIEFYNAEFFERSLQAMEALQKNYPQSPFKDQASLWKAKIYLQQQNHSNALRELSTIPQQSGEYPAALFMTGRVYQAIGKSLEAIGYYTQVAGLYPDQDFSDDALILASQLYISQKKGNAALQALLKVIKNYPDRETVDDAYYWLGKLLSTDPNLKDVELARKVYTIFLKRAEDPSHPSFYSSPLKERVAEDLKRLDAMYFSD